MIYIISAIPIACSLVFIAAMVICAIKEMVYFISRSKATKYKTKVARLEKINLALFTELEKVKDEMKSGSILYHQGREAFDYPTTEIQKALDMAMEYHDEP